MPPEDPYAFPTYEGDRIHVTIRNRGGTKTRLGMIAYEAGARWDSGNMTMTVVAGRREETLTRPFADLHQARSGTSRSIYVTDGDGVPYPPFRLPDSLVARLDQPK